MKKQVSDEQQGKEAADYKKKWSVQKIGTVGANATAMVPHEILGREWENRDFVAEKPGLDVVSISGVEEVDSEERLNGIKNSVLGAELRVHNNGCSWN